MKDEHLSVAIGTCANADCGAVDRGGDFTCERRGNLLEYDAEATDVCEHFRVFAQALRLLIFLGPNRVRAKLVDALWGQSKMSHHRNAPPTRCVRCSPEPRDPFEFDGVRPAFMMRIALFSASFRL